MKLLVSLCLCTFMLSKLSSQTHHLGLNFGINQILSTDNEPPFGKGSPWKSTLGFSYEFHYHYTLKNKLTLGLNLGYLNPRFIDQDASTFIDELNERIVADETLLHFYLAYSINVGYKWRLFKRYSIHLTVGPKIIYDDKQKSFVKGYEDKTLFVNDFNFSQDRINYGLRLNINQSYTLIQDWNYRLNLIASLGSTYIIDYLHFYQKMNRYLPQFSVGLELELGRRKR